jgi:urease accessory protein
MDKFKVSKVIPFPKTLSQFAIFSALTISSLLMASPAFAHHAMSGKMPANFFQGFISGIAHPLIGPDHLAFIVSVGLLAAIKRQGISIPIAFVLAAMLGTGFHLTEIAFPGVELFVSGSILLFGILLVMKNLPHTIVIATIAAISGIFHGYAYGESIFGAEITPLLAYLIGFSSIQLAISLSAFWIGKNIIRQGVAESSSKFDRAGWVICGVGLAFFLSQLVALIFPVASS